MSYKNRNIERVQVDAKEKGSLDVEGLRPATSYNITVFGFSEFGDQIVESTPTYLTTVTALSPPYILTSEKYLTVTNKSISIAWNEVNNAYRYEAKIDSEVDRKPKHITAGLKNVAEWKNLESDTEYVIHIRAISNSMDIPDSNWSEIILRTSPNSPEIYVTEKRPFRVQLAVAGIQQGDKVYYESAVDWDVED